MKRKMIFNSYIARQLLKSGFPIIDILKNNNIENATIFVFEETEDFIHKLTELTLAK